MEESLRLPDVTPCAKLYYDPTGKPALSKLFDFINANKVRFMPTMGCERIGIIDIDGHIYFKKNSLEIVLEQMEVNPSTFIRWAKMKGYTRCSEGRTTISKRFPGEGVIRCVCFHYTT